MKRLCIFAHYDSDREVKRYILFHLQQLRGVCDQLIFVSTANLESGETKKLDHLCDTVLQKENRGLDFGMWKYAIEQTDISEFDELVLTNSSVIGPMHPLAPIFGRMSEQECDFWGMTENSEIAWHLQSYFLVFRKTVLTSEIFRKFWDDMLLYDNKERIIREYEVGLSTVLVHAGFKPKAAFPSALIKKSLMDRIRQHEIMNVTMRYPTQMLQRGMPYIKIRLLHDNGTVFPKIQIHWLRNAVKQILIHPVYREIRRSSYDMSLIEPCMKS